MRQRLIGLREAIDPEQRSSFELAISLNLLHGIPLVSGTALGFCWPHRGEYDIRPLLPALLARQVRLALPIVQKATGDLVFHEWTEQCVLAQGPLGIPFPVDTPRLVPTVLLIPIVGYGAAGDRLGYGGGYYDRTLAQMNPRPLCIGVGFDCQRIESSFPQPHDIPMDAIVTETQLQVRDGDQLEAMPARWCRQQLQTRGVERGLWAAA
jgi:5,10-methenyltetrahydrofolate synthetase